MIKRIISIFATLSLAGVFFVVSTTPASAGENMGRVRNYTGNLVKIACEYGHPSNTLEEKYPEKGSNSTEFCPLDTDQFLVKYDKRCIKYIGPKVKDGWYQVDPEEWLKVFGFGLVKVYAWTVSRCGDKPFYKKK